MNSIIKTIFAALVAVVALFASSNAWADSVVNVEMWNDGAEMALRLDKTAVPAGKVTFKGTNTSNDETVHEMLVLKVESTLPNLPYNEDEGRVPEDGIESLGEIPEVEAGAKGELVLDMKPGTYLLFCNKAQHFASHMKTLFFVK